MTHRPNAMTHTQEYRLLPGVVRHTFIIFGLFTTPNLCPLTQNPGDATAYRHTCWIGRPGLAHRLINFLPNRHSAIAPSSHLTASKFSPTLIVLFNWLPSWLLPRVIAETGCLRCRLYHAASNSTTRQSCAYRSTSSAGLACPAPLPTGSQVDARGLRSLVCKQAPGRSSRHHILNDLELSYLFGSQLPKSQLAWNAKTARDQMAYENNCHVPRQGPSAFERNQREAIWSHADSF